MLYGFFTFRQVNVEEFVPINMFYFAFFCLDFEPIFNWLLDARIKQYDNLWN